MLSVFFYSRANCLSASKVSISMVTARMNCFLLLFYSALSTSDAFSEHRSKSRSQRVLDESLATAKREVSLKQSQISTVKPWDNQTYSKQDGCQCRCYIQPSSTSKLTTSISKCSISMLKPGVRLDYKQVNISNG